MKLYAGTTRPKADQALLHGLSRPLSVTNDVDQAWWLAEDKAESAAVDPAVLEVEVDPASLFVDDRAWEDPPQTVLDDLGLADENEFRTAVASGRIRRPSDPSEGVASLEGVRWAVHRGPIPPGAIREVFRPFEEEEESGEIGLYVGTTRAKAERALARGVSRPITLYGDIDEAIEEAALKAGDAGDLPVVLRIAADVENLRVDPGRWEEPPVWVMTRYGIGTVPEWHEAVAQGYVLVPRNERDWRRSLEVMETVRHEGPIPPGRIMVAWDEEDA